MVNEEQELRDQKGAQEEAHTNFLVRLLNGFGLVGVIVCGFSALLIKQRKLPSVRRRVKPGLGSEEGALVDLLRPYNQ